MFPPVRLPPRAFRAVFVCAYAALHGVLSYAMTYSHKPHSMNTTRPQNRSGRSLQLSRCPTLGLPQLLYWVLGYSKSVVVPPTLQFCSRSWLEVAHLVSCEPNWIQSEWFFFLSFSLPVSDSTRSVAHAKRISWTCHSQFARMGDRGIGLQSRALTYPFFFFFFSFFCFCFCFVFNDFSLTTLRTNYHLP